MVRAAIHGLIDLSVADPRSRLWQQRLVWTLLELMDQDDKETLALKHRHKLGLIAADNLTDQSFKNAWEAATEYRDQILAIYFRTPAADRKQAATEAISGWEAVYGKLDSEEVQAKLDEALAYFEALDAKYA